VPLIEKTRSKEFESKTIKILLTKIAIKWGNFIVLFLLLRLVYWFFLLLLIKRKKKRINYQQQQVNPVVLRNYKAKEIHKKGDFIKTKNTFSHYYL